MGRGRGKMFWLNLAKIYVGTKLKNISKILQRILKEKGVLKPFENHNATTPQAIIKSGKLEVNIIASLDTKTDPATQ